MSGLELVRQGFAAHQENRLNEAMTAYRKGLALEVNLGDALYLAGIIVHSSGHVSEARSFFLRAVAIDPDNPEFQLAAGKIDAELKNYAMARRAMRRATVLVPGNVEARSSAHAIGAILFARLEGRADPRFLGETYNHLGPSLTPNPYAERLRECFGPILERDCAGHLATMLDIGCGTGPAGPQFEAYCKDITGVDMSVRSLEMARARRVYRRLIQSDIETFMASEPDAQYSALIAGGSLCYFGDLTKLFRQARRILVRKGFFAFTIFRSALAEPEADQERESFGIFKHSRPYIERVAAATGFELVSAFMDVKIFDQGRRDIIDDLYVLRSRVE